MFYVGDIVTRISSNRYGYTNKDDIMEVVAVREEYIIVKIINHKKYKTIIGKECLVDPNELVLVDGFKEVTDDMIADGNDIDSLLG